MSRQDLNVINQDVQDHIDAANRVQNQEPNIADDNVSLVSVEPPELPITFLIKFIKPFDGNRDELISFISDCNKAFSLATRPQKYVLLDYILTQISGKAKAACVNRSFSNWDELKIFLKTMYQDKKHYSQLLCELTTLKQNQNESISQFVCRVETCLKRTINATQQQTTNPVNLDGKIEMLNEIALNRFLHFTLPNISNVLRIRDLKTLNEAISVAIAEEQVQNMYNHTKSFINKTTFNNYSRNSFPKSVQNRSNNPVQKENNNSNIKARVYQATNKASESNQNSSSKIEKFCRYCKNKGHEIEECLKRQFNNNKKKNKAQSSKNECGAPVQIAQLEQSPSI